MASGALCFLLIVIGWALLWVVPRLGSGLAKAAAVRLSMLSFVAAGTVGAGGWLGDLTHWTVVHANAWGNQFGREALGSAVMWIVWAVLCVAWAVGFLPTSLIRFDPPDWLAMFGFFLPVLAHSIPGGIGGFFQGLFELIGDAGQEIVQSGFEG